MAPEPPETPGELAPSVAVRGDEAARGDEEEGGEMETDEYAGYEPLALGPHEDTDLRMWNSAVMSDSSDDEQEVVPEEATAEESNYVPAIESIEREITRELWTAPREEINIEMNPEKAQEVMTAMANFSLPASSFPEWAHSITEEEWRQQLAKRINITHDNR